jgi:hypothetical protein
MISTLRRMKSPVTDEQKAYLVTKRFEYVETMAKRSVVESFRQESEGAMRSLLVWVVLLGIVGLLAWSLSSPGQDAAKIAATDEGALHKLKTVFDSHSDRVRESVESRKADVNGAHELGKIEWEDEIALRLKREEYQEKARKAVKLAKEAVAEAELWTEQMVPLFRSRKGMTLLRSDAIRDAFYSVYFRERPDPEDAAFVLKQAENLYDSLKEGEFVKVKMLSEPTDPFKEWADQARRITGAYRNARLEVEGLLQEAARLPATEDRRYSLLRVVEAMQRREAAARVLPSARENTSANTSTKNKDCPPDVLAKMTSTEAAIFYGCGDGSFDRFIASFHVREQGKR